MPTYERSTVVDAPFDAVWAFHSRPGGLVDLTPTWLDLRIEEVRRPSGAPLGTDETGDQILETGARIRASVRPFGVGPRVEFVSHIIEHHRGDDVGRFVDEMHRGPVPEWRHAHHFEAVSGGTSIRDHVDFQLPGGPAGWALGQLGRVALEPMFRYRHRRTRELLA